MGTIISGKVIKGKGKGIKLGFPTINIELGDKIESGVYKGKVITREFKNSRIRANDKLIGANNKLGVNEWLAGIFIGEDGKILEAHLIGFSGDLYGREIEVEIGDKIREVMKFRDDERLKEQIKRDIDVIRNL